jgi:hypothetical protein
VVARRPPKATSDADLSEFALRDPQADRAVTSFAKDQGVGCGKPGKNPRR